MDVLQTICAVLMIGVTIIRLIINSVIYRKEYSYEDHTDGVAISYDEESVRKRDNGVILFVLALFTFVWYNLSTNRNNKLWVNVLSGCFFLLLAGYYFA